ncbi:MAG: phasin family protein [Gammaproteobacteria bacterium]
MSNQSSQFFNQAKDAGQSAQEALQGVAETQFKILQQLGDVQRKVLGQAAEATRTQLQLMSKMNNPREFATAQADLIKEYGQKYVDSINETVRVMSQAWEEYGGRVEGMKSAAGDMQEASRAAAQEGKESSNGGKKAPSSKKSS